MHILTLSVILWLSFCISMLLLMISCDSFAIFYNFEKLANKNTELLPKNKTTIILKEFSILAGWVLLV
jgi:hypothetical protein